MVDFSLFNFSILVDIWWYLIGVSILIFLVSNDVEHHVIYIFFCAIHVSSLVKNHLTLLPVRQKTGLRFIFFKRVK